MDPNIQVVKAYLLSLGYEIDNNSYNKFVNALKKADKAIEEHTGMLSNKYVKAGLAVSSVIGSIVIGTYELTNAIAKADLGYEKLALRMYMTKDAAKAYSIALKSLKEEPANIRWIPELHKQYMQLMEDAQKLMPGKDFSGRMQDFRSLNFEFKRMKQEAMYGLEWVGFSILNRLVDPIGKAKFNLHSLNDYIIENIPRWGDKIGDFITRIFMPLEGIWKLVTRIGDGFSLMWDNISNPQKALLGVAALGTILYMLSPLSRAIATVTFLAIEMFDALSGKTTFLPIEVYQSFAIAIDAVARAMIGLLAVMQAGHDLEKAIAGYGRWGLQSIVSFGASTLGFDKFSKGQKESAEKSLKQGRESWGKAATLPKTLYDLINPKSGEFLPWYEGSKLWMSNEMRENLNKQFISSLNKGISPGKIANLEKYKDIINKAALSYNLPPELIEGVIMQESSGRGRPGEPVKNKKTGEIERAQGLMQLMPSSFPWMSMEDLNNPEANIMAGSKYLKELLNKSGGKLDVALSKYYGRYDTNYIGGVRSYMDQYARNPFGAGSNVVLGSNNNIDLNFNITSTNPIEAAEELKKILNEDPILKRIRDTNLEVRTKNEAAVILMGMGNRPSTQGSPMTPVRK